MVCPLHRDSTGPKQCLLQLALLSNKSRRRSCAMRQDKACWSVEDNDGHAEVDRSCKDALDPTSVIVAFRQGIRATKVLDVFKLFSLADKCAQARGRKRIRTSRVKRLPPSPLLLALVTSLPTAAARGCGRVATMRERTSGVMSSTVAVAASAGDQPPNRGSKRLRQGSDDEGENKWCHVDNSTGHKASGCQQQ
jgi:hypothetical protein